MVHSEVSLANIRILRDYAEIAPDGAFVEIGVYQGGTAVWLAEIADYRDSPLYLYDTFEGMPFAGPLDGIPAGAFSETSLDQVKTLLPRAHLVPGVFPDSLIDMPPVSFVHADCDQYESVKAVIDVMPSRMVENGVIYFDDYGSLQGATQAVEEAGDYVVLPNGKAIMRITHVAH